MSKLFEPLHIKSVTLPNRIVVSPMCQYSAVDGFANDWHLVHLGSRAVGGAGLIIAEATAVTAEGRITPHDIGLYKDEHVDFLKKITDFIKQHNSVPGIQIAHAGRKASHHHPWEGGKALTPSEGLWTPVAPSAIAYKEGEPVPHALTAAEIQQLVLDFKQAAKRALAAGFEVLEIHAAHGYLIHEFLSPLSNERKDDYGGDFTNRIRLLIEITEAIQEVWPENLPLFVRISATDWFDGGWTLEESVELAKILKTKGVDLIDCSSGGNASGQRIALKPMYQVPFAETIKKQAAIKTGAVGLITTPQEAESIIAAEQADLIFLGREFLRDPYFPMHAAQVLGADIHWPPQYERAKL